MIRFLCTALLLLAACAAPAAADPIAVHQTQGATRGFLVLRGGNGEVIGTGDIIQSAHGDRLTSKLIFHFRDGSLDEDTTVYTQRGTFKLVSDHHVQKGPFFSKPSDVLVDVASGMVTTRTVGDDGKAKVESEHKDLPLDLYNGLVGAVLLNVAHDVQPFKLGMILPSGKGRLVKLAIEPAGEGSFREEGIARRASIFRIKVELGGIGGVVAPIIGKQPEDTMVWVFEGEVPVLVRLVGQLSEGGPTVSIELSGTAFAKLATPAQ